MRAYGKKIKGPCACEYCRNDNPKSKKPERHKAKLAIKRDMQPSPTDKEMDAEKEIRLSQEDERYLRNLGK